MRPYEIMVILDHARRTHRCPSLETFLTWSAGRWSVDKVDIWAGAGSLTNLKHAEGIYVVIDLKARRDRIRAGPQLS